MANTADHNDVPVSIAVHFAPHYVRTVFLRNHKTEILHVCLPYGFERPAWPAGTKFGRRSKVASELPVHAVINKFTYCILPVILAFLHMERC